MRSVLLLVLLCAGGCRALEITPYRVARAAGVPAAERSAHIARWRMALGLANQFLASAHSQTLPAGRFALDDRRGMRFLTADGRRYPVRVRFTLGGDLTVALGSVAQERHDGFVVGAASGRTRHMAVDHTLFLRVDGAPRSAIGMAELILHETAHVVFREGTVSWWATLTYYLEVLLTGRTHREHSVELLPRRVDAEWAAFLLADGAGS